jgi:hypothetical protein
MSNPMHKQCIPEAFGPTSNELGAMQKITHSSKDTTPFDSFFPQTGLM